MELTLITGPVRSGKSRFAVKLAMEAGSTVTYVATAAVDPDDAEWSGRLERHRRERPSEWVVVETAGGRGPALRDVLRDANPKQVLLVDSLGTWLADRMKGTSQGDIGADVANAPALERGLESDCEMLCAALLASEARAAILIGEEVGWAVHPERASARVFRDVLGRLHQRIAAHADRLYLTVSGFALDLKALGVPIDPTSDAAALAPRVHAGL